jgi:hypothetical protein
VATEKVSEEFRKAFRHPSPTARFPREHAEEQLYDVEAIAPDLGGYVLDASGFEDLVHVRVAVEAEADWTRAEDDAGRAELAGHPCPYDRAALEAVDVVHVAHGHRERAARCA